MQSSFRITMLTMLVIAILVFQMPVYPANSIGNHRTRGSEPPLRIAIINGITTLNLLSAMDDSTLNVIRWMFDGLTWENVSNGYHIEPWAAEWFHHGAEDTWGPEPYSDNDNNTDFLNWTVRLRIGIKWHDWKEFDVNGDGVLDPNDPDERKGMVTANDVLFSLRLMADTPKYSAALYCLLKRDENGSVVFSNYSGYGELPEVNVRVVDNWTLVYNLSYPYRYFTSKTLGLPIFPERIWKNHIPDKLTWSDPQALINFGQFEFDCWNGTGGRISTFRDYFHAEYDGKRRQKPYLDAIEFIVYSSIDLAVDALVQNYKVDYIAWRIDPQYIDKIVKDPYIALVRNSDCSFDYIGINMRFPEFGYAGYLESDAPQIPGEPPKYEGNYTDIGKPFRKAMAYLTDKSRIVIDIFDGFGCIGTSVISPVNSFWYNPNVKIYEYNVSKAERILDDYAPDTDGDGIRELPYRSEKAISMLVPPADCDPAGARMSTLIQNEARNLGLNITSVPTSPSTLVEKMGNRDFDMYLAEWRSVTERESINVPWELAHSENDFQGGTNYAGYHNRTFDALCYGFEKEMETRERKNISFELQNSIAENLPYIVLYYRDRLEAYSSMWVGWIPAYGTLFNIHTLRNLKYYSYPCWQISLSTPSIINSGEGIEVRAYVYSLTTNEPLSGVNVSFSADNGTLFPEYAITDANGCAMVRFTAPIVRWNSTTVKITATYYNEWADMVLKATREIVVLPQQPPPETEIEMEIYPPMLLNVGENETVPLEIRVYNKDTLEYYGRYNGTLGVLLNYSIFPEDAAFDLIDYENGTWTFEFRGHAHGDFTQYNIFLNAVLYSFSEPVTSAWKNITINVMRALEPEEPTRENNATTDAEDGNGTNTSVDSLPPDILENTDEFYILAGGTALLITGISVLVIIKRRKLDKGNDRIN